MLCAHAARLLQPRRLWIRSSTCVRRGHASSQKLLDDADATEQKMLGQFPISNHLKDLPYTSTFEMSPDAQLVGYLSQHTTHAIRQAKPEIDALMAK